MPGLVISVISLAIVFYLADFGQMLAALRLADYRLILLNGLITLLWLVVRAKVWRTLLQEKASLRQTFWTINEGYLINNILPLRLGEAARAFLLGRKANLPFVEVLSTIVIERALDLIIAVGLLLSTLPFVLGADWAAQAAIVTGAIVLSGLGMLYLLARRQDWALQQFEKLARRFGSAALLQIGQKQLVGFLNGLGVLTDTSRFLRAIFWMLLDWGIAVGQYYTLLLAFVPEARFLWAGFSLSAAALGMAVPSSPGALGVFEATLVGALFIFGISHSTGLAVALTAHLISYLLTGLLGAFALARDGVSLGSLYNQARHINGGEGRGDPAPTE